MDDLRAAAQAATHGEWRAEKADRGDTGMFLYPSTDKDGGEWVGFTHGPNCHKDAAYIALASPDRILGILSELERKTAALEGMVKEWDENGPFEVNEYTGGDKVSERWLLTVELARAALEGKPTDG